jgi:hypothetical protein
LKDWTDGEGTLYEVVYQAGTSTGRFLPRKVVRDAGGQNLTREYELDDLGIVLSIAEEGVDLGLSRTSSFTPPASGPRFAE